ncbi:PTS sugar transporter subunit IIA [Brucella tritici]|uniref:PTS sugar transporter subunit IIA n=1 Tax=Brucella tritici TaxID=94626 RepID=A0A7V7VSW9_9HYPH|nr:PTS sugar transporter subunit IIA [Brucella tritici]KAB2656347.1 PTS sugar transporter subunit IIA [Brucella tritici]
MAAGLINFLDPQAIELQSEAKTNEEIIRILAGKLEKLGYVKPSYADAVVSRELSMPTGLPLEREENVAVPHTDPEHVIRAGIAFATLKSPIHFANMEDPEEAVPVGYVFLLAIDDKDKQIETLQQIMATIQDADALDRLKAARTLEDVETALQ